MQPYQSRFLGAVLAGLAVSGCVTTVPLQSTLTVIPGEGKTEADLRADDVACRVARLATNGTAGAGVAATPVSADQYYGCMASRGQAVIQQQPVPYPVYARAVPYAYPAYGYPYYGSPYGYGYPYYGGYYGPYVGFGVGFGYGRFGGGHGGYGGWRGGYGGGHGGFRR